MGLHQAPHDRQANPEATLCAFERLPLLYKQVENAWQGLWRNAVAVVRHPDDDAGGLTRVPTPESCPAGSVYFAALLRRLAKTCARRAASPSISNPVATSTCSVCRRSSIAGLAISMALATTSASWRRSLSQLHLSASDAGHVEQIVDQPHDVLDLALDDAALAVGADDAAQIHQLQRREDRRQRIAQLVPEHRQEFVLRAVRRFRLTPRLGELGHFEAHDRDPRDAAVFGERLVDEVEERLLGFRAAAIEHDPHGSADIRLARREHVVEQLVESLPAELRQRRRESVCRRPGGVPTIARYAWLANSNTWSGPRRIATPTGACSKMPASRSAWASSTDRTLRAHHLRLDARDQLARGERLDEIVVRAGLQPLDARLFAGTRRQQDHRHRLRPLVGAQALQQLEPVELRHHDVGDDHVGTVRLRRRQRGGAVAHRFDRPSVAEQARDVLAHVGVVVGHEDARRSRGRRRLRRPVHGAAGGR